jgi:hypothetical protein
LFGYISLRKVLLKYVIAGKMDEKTREEEDVGSY